MLTDLITRYQEAKAVWEAQWDADETAASDSPEWRRYMALSCEIIDFRCSTMEEISTRAKFMLSDVNLVDMLANCSTEAAARDFLGSMVLPVDNTPVDCVDNGEN